MPSYIGNEAPVALMSTDSPEPDAIFELRPAGVPTKAVPIFDDELSVVIGYRDETTTGVFRLYDLDGRVVGLEERGLESPAFDPIDLLFVASGVVRAIGKGVLTSTVRTAPKVAALTSKQISTRMLAASVFGEMRSAYKGLTVKSLQFTTTTAARMATKGRYVPIHILHLAIKYGRRGPDPQGVTGAFLYTTKMIRNGQEYLLEVIVREADWTILHFMYK